MPKPVFLKLKSDSPFLTAIGHLYSHPAPAQMAGSHPFSIRNTVGAEFEVNPGRYDFCFIVKNGEGKFTVKAPGATNAGAPPAKDFDTASDGFTGLTFTFEVV